MREVPEIAWYRSPAPSARRFVSCTRSRNWAFARGGRRTGGFILSILERLLGARCSRKDDRIYIHSAVGRAWESFNRQQRARRYPGRRPGGRSCLSPRRAPRHRKDDTGIAVSDRGSASRRPLPVCHLVGERARVARRRGGPRVEFGRDRCLRARACRSESRSRAGADAVSPRRDGARRDGETHPRSGGGS